MTGYNSVLTIAGSDSSAGAGIQADLKTIAALGSYGLSVITALTAQNTQGVQEILAIPPQFVTAQLNSIFQDIPVNAVKIGMVHNIEMIKTLAAYLKPYSLPIVIDSVMTAKGGAQLIASDAIQVLKSELLPLATVVTPNIPEAEALSGLSPIQTYADMERAAIYLGEQGIAAVLIKGGHLEDRMARDCLYIKSLQELRWYESLRIRTPNTHGTGCTLSAAIATYLAQGIALPDAIERARQYLLKALKAGSTMRLGQGNGPLQHFFAGSL